MTDYATTNITPGAPAGPGLTGVTYVQRPIMDYVPEMNAHVTPKTPSLSGGSGPRSNVGLVFPR